MTPDRRIFWFVFAAITPIGFIGCTLLYQIRKVEIETFNAEAELRLGRQAQESAQARKFYGRAEALADLEAAEKMEAPAPSSPD